jgi:hypothetical protein
MQGNSSGAEGSLKYFESLLKIRMFPITLVKGKTDGK